MVDGAEVTAVTAVPDDHHEASPDNSFRVEGVEVPSVTSAEVTGDVAVTDDHGASPDVPNTPAPFLPTHNSTVCQKRLRSLSPHSPSPSPSTPLSPLDIDILRKKFHLDFGMPWIGVSLLFISRIWILIFALRPQLLRRVQPQTTLTVGL